MLFLLPHLDIIAHSMGGLVSKGMLTQANDALQQRLRLFISIASPFSRTADGKSVGDDGVVTVKSQLASSAQRNATAVYGIADSHKGVIGNPCTAALVTAILQDGTARVSSPDC